MSDPGSNRSNLAISQYYQELADVIGIFWQFHKERLQAGTFEFALSGDYAARKAITFHPSRWIEIRRARTPLPQIGVINEFSDAVEMSMRLSWQQFLQGLGLPTISDGLEIPPVEDKQKRFFDGYTRSLAESVDSKVDLYAKASIRGEKNISSVTEAGMHTGSEATVQLAAIFDNEFKPGTAVQLSKVDQDHLRTALDEVGLSENPALPRRYGLLDISPLGLNTRRLRELGLGNTLGCPASMKISGETQSYLQEQGVRVNGRTMLEDFAGMMPGQFDRYVRGWYNELTDGQRVTDVKPEDRRILTGELRRSIIPSPRCPYNKER